MRYDTKAILAAVLFTAALVAQDERPDAPTTLRGLVEEAVENVQVFADEDAEEPARPFIGLRWDNNTRGSEDGMTVLYLHEGRPIAAACVFPLRGSIVHEFSALAPQGVIARRKDQSSPLWQTRESVVTYAPIPDAPRPETSPAGRLRQMKALAGEFQATTLGWDPANVNREELRLLPRPMYRYEAKDPVAKQDGKEAALIDGAAFVFVTGTDPEALLLIEAVRKSSGPVWQYGFARRTTAAVEARHRDKVVWSVEGGPSARDPRQALHMLSTPIPAEILQAVKE